VSALFIPALNDGTFRAKVIKMCECINLSSRISGKKVEELKNLAPYVDEVKTDFKKWETTFRCRDCGQVWIERYESHGQGDIPIVERA
jgi:hypothetical protein